mgnify:CR=1 FL=1
MRKRDKFRRGSKRFSQFTLVGILNAAVDFGVLNLFLWLAPTRDPWELALFNGIALVLANLNSYWWNTRWTFRSRAENDLRQVVLFALQVLVNIGVSSAIFWALIHPLLTDTDIPAYLVGNVAKLISVIVASTISFFIMRYLVFSRKRWFGGRL